MHELSSENLRRVVPVVEPGHWHGLISILLWQDEYETWTILAQSLRGGKRHLRLRVELTVNAWPRAAWLPLGTISTVAELREWYVRLGGKGWGDEKR